MYFVFKCYYVNNMLLIITSNLWLGKVIFKGFFKNTNNLSYQSNNLSTNNGYVMYNNQRLSMFTGFIKLTYGIYVFARFIELQENQL